MFSLLSGYLYATEKCFPGYEGPIGHRPTRCRGSSAHGKRSKRPESDQGWSSTEPRTQSQLDLQSHIHVSSLRSSFFSFDETETDNIQVHDPILLPWLQSFSRSPGHVSTSTRTRFEESYRENEQVHRHLSFEKIGFRAWETEKRVASTKHRPASLLKAIIREYWKEVAIWGFFLLVEVLFSIISLIFDPRKLSNSHSQSSWDD